MNFIEKEGVFRTGEWYTLLGRPINGESYEVDEDIVVVGEDAAVILPEYNVVAVFDGAGGTKDLGSPREAALTAADAVRREYRAHDGDITGADVMRQAGAAVAANPEASLCMGALLRIHRRLLEVVNVGDTGVWTYNPTNNEEKMIAEQQLDRMYHEPANYMGRTHRLMPSRTMTDLHMTVPHDKAAEVYIGTDGVLGDFLIGHDLMYSGHMQAAHEGIFMLLDHAVSHDKDFIPTIKKRLAGPSGEQLRREQLKGYNEVISPELTNPELFTGKYFDWDIWDNIVMPYIQERDISRDHALSRRAILMSIIDPTIRWPFEDWKTRDDATVVMIAHPSRCDGSIVY